ncbi:DUF2809 domain-containing protein [Sphingomonas jatrophae]|uniref:DUF2809 domain-containing protein n=1 Tax=Sphingomonas jatrophae TaxID=1166337 RepID=A0A1I6M7P8_9SPHN|nr:DUF2809 domain-containing protein [Sphingomonas jatrophae]SFS11724.1 Protein of unknown function [Sphingomonas jatrophae]
MLLTEVAIALCVHDRIIRPHVGDSLAVVLVYLTLRASTPLGVGASVLAALVVACAVEVSQLFQLVDAIGLGHLPAARVILGTGFDLLDFFAYAAGGALVFAGDRLRLRGEGGGASA